MTQTVGNIVLPGPCKVFIAPYSPTSLQTAPASTIAYGADWAGTWVEVGYTQGGVVLKTSTDRLTSTMDQVNAPLTDFITAQGATITFAAGEATLANLKQALGYGTLTTGSTESSLGVSATDAVATYYTVGFEQFGPNVTAAAQRYRRAIVWKAMPLPEVEIGGEKTKENLVAYSFEARYEAQAAATERLYKIIDRVA